MSGLLVMAVFPSFWKLPYVACSRIFPIGFVTAVNATYMARLVIVPIYILRTTFTSVGWPLINSVLNDYVAKNHRYGFLRILNI